MIVEFGAQSTPIGNNQVDAIRTSDDRTLEQVGRHTFWTALLVPTQRTIWHSLWHGMTAKHSWDTDDDPLVDRHLRKLEPIERHCVGGRHRGKR